MAIDKVLLKIQNQITDLVHHLEEFVQPNVQPGTKECDLLKNQLAQLQDLLTIYNHLKQEKEISPSFNIHAKVSKTSESEINAVKENKIIDINPKIVEAETIKQNDEIIEKTESEVNSVAAPTKSTSTTKLNIGLNDKFRFINELFNQNANEYNIAIEQFNTITTLNDAERFCTSLSSLYNWNEKSETVKYFITIINIKFK
ncbi:MAG: hypothetical protein LCH32_08600 [Bacteroidetes bacterium]|nr:hypothetical protein [Bacteroidota bacterium]